jgi:hypothetical protein
MGQDQSFLMLFSENARRTIDKKMLTVHDLIKQCLQEGKTEDQHQSLVQNSIPRLQLWFEVLLAADEVK